MACLQKISSAEKRLWVADGHSGMVSSFLLVISLESYFFSAFLCFALTFCSLFFNNPEMTFFKVVHFIYLLSQDLSRIVSLWDTVV